jgi:hypothetical protein
MMDSNPIPNSSNEHMSIETPSSKIAQEHIASAEIKLKEQTPKAMASEDFDWGRNSWASILNGGTQAQPAVKI